MENEFVAVQNVKDLQDTGKHWLESVLGHHLQENQQVYIMVCTPGAQPDAAARRQALQSWERITQAVAQNLEKSGITPEQFDAAVDESMQHVRPRGA